MYDRKQNASRPLVMKRIFKILCLVLVFGMTNACSNSSKNEESSISTEREEVAIPVGIKMPTSDQITRGEGTDYATDEVVIGIDRSIANPDREAIRIATENEMEIIGSGTSATIYQLRSLTPVEEYETLLEAIELDPATTYAARHLMEDPNYNE